MHVTRKTDDYQQILLKLKNSVILGKQGLG